jgi:hypothetical protein
MRVCGAVQTDARGDAGDDERGVGVLHGGVLAAGVIFRKDVARGGWKANLLGRIGRLIARAAPAAA